MNVREKIDEGGKVYRELCLLFFGSLLNREERKLFVGSTLKKLSARFWNESSMIMHLC